MRLFRRRQPESKLFGSCARESTRNSIIRDASAECESFVGVRSSSSSSSSSNTALIAASTFAAAAKNDEEQHRVQPGAAVASRHIASARKTIAGGKKSWRERVNLATRFTSVLLSRRIVAKISLLTNVRVAINNVGRHCDAIKRIGILGGNEKRTEGASARGRRTCLTVIVEVRPGPRESVYPTAVQHP
ncbi:uncharacterized protein LOC116842844 [Odontomachus brunneus]|uniref:uncharacterized protein LOC116842844 n=1 Tax=Odontomachus brunneus TaxID=486640 RepID=UPI0013F21BFC|nr:uncharacterized protein LOC116842844 [Odontomachus brunneus]